jgi:hypothetical protein
MSKCKHGCSNKHHMRRHRQGGTCRKCRPSRDTAEQQAANGHGCTEHLPHAVFVASEPCDTSQRCGILMVSLSGGSLVHLVGLKWWWLMSATDHACGIPTRACMWYHYWLHSISVPLCLPTWSHVWTKQLSHALSNAPEPCDEANAVPTWSHGVQLDEHQVHAQHEVALDGNYCRHNTRQGNRSERK